MLALILCSIDDVLNKDRYDKQKTPTHVGVFCLVCLIRINQSKPGMHQHLTMFQTQQGLLR
jgi:hypothetical protein